MWSGMRYQKTHLVSELTCHTTFQQLTNLSLACRTCGVLAARLAEVESMKCPSGTLALLLKIGATPLKVRLIVDDSQWYESVRYRLDELVPRYPL